jgi:hypothetical protein
VSHPPDVNETAFFLITGHIDIHRIPTPADTTLWRSIFFGVFWGIFGAIGFVLSLVFPEKDSSFNARYVPLRKRKTYPTKGRKKT